MHDAAAFTAGNLGRRETCTAIIPSMRTPADSFPPRKDNMPDNRVISEAEVLDYGSQVVTNPIDTHIPYSQGPKTRPANAFKSWTCRPRLRYYRPYAWPGTHPKCRKPKGRLSPGKIQDEDRTKTQL